MKCIECSETLIKKNNKFYCMNQNCRNMNEYKLTLCGNKKVLIPIKISNKLRVKFKPKVEAK